MLHVLVILWASSLLVLGSALGAVIAGQNATRLLRDAGARLAARRIRAGLRAAHSSS